MADIQVQIPKKAFNAAYISYLGNDNRYLVFYGGAGSGKSYFIAERYLVKIMQAGMCNVLVVRAVGNTNRDSTFALFKQVISKWNLSSLFKINESDLRITCTNGNSVIFKGLDDTEKLKSITFAKGELTDVWIEEASETLEPDFNQLNIRLRGKGTKKQIVISFNPIDINHWLKKRFFDRKDDNITICHTTYKDNRFLDDEYVQLLESYKETDPYYYAVYCLGEWGVYGKTIFDKFRVTERIAQLKGQTLKTGYFYYKYSEDGLTDIRWIDDPDGYIKIIKPPKQGYPYVIGGDTAGEGEDFFTAQVLDNTTGEQVAVLKNQFDEDLYADQIYCLGLHYNTALIGIESNYTPAPIKRLQDLHYPRQYVRQQAEDNYTHAVLKKYGFNTNKSTRPVIIAELVKIVREKVELINNIDTLNEMLTFVRATEGAHKGRPQAAEGAHDDLVMALAIAHYIRTQQRFEPEKPQGAYKYYTEDMLEDYYNASPEEKEQIIKEWGIPING